MCPPLSELQKPDPLGLPAARPSHVLNLPPNGDCRDLETAKGIKLQLLAMGEGGSAPNDSTMFAWLSWR